jgi:hypothetical protein
MSVTPEAAGSSPVDPANIFGFVREMVHTDWDIGVDDVSLSKASGPMGRVRHSLQP